MISSPSADTDTADVLIGVATASVQDAADFAGIEQLPLWALQRQTDADMIRDVTHEHVADRRVQQWVVGGEDAAAGQTEQGLDVLHLQ